MELKLPELRAASSFLRQAHMLVSGVCSLFHNVGDADRSASLNDITGRITDEIGIVEKKIAAARN